jgi:general secretion pathway protein G
MLFDTSMTNRICSKRWRAKAEDGFTLLELLVVLGILALIAAIGYPQVLRYMGTARAETAKAQMSAIATSLELYALDNGRFPSQQAGLTALVQAPPGVKSWRGPYLKKAEGLRDPWGHPYQYRVPGRSSGFELATLGRDNTPGGDGEDQDLVHQ